MKKGKGAQIVVLEGPFGAPKERGRAVAPSDPLPPRYCLAGGLKLVQNLNTKLIKSAILISFIIIILKKLIH